MKARGGSAPLVALLVHQKTSLALLGLTGRQYLDLLDERAVPHTEFKRLKIARVDRVLAALGLADDVEPAAAADEPEPAWDRARVIEMATRRGAQ